MFMSFSLNKYITRWKELHYMVQDVIKKASKVSFIRIMNDTSGETIFNIPIWVVALIAIALFTIIRVRKSR
ncbi:hypothetical protein KDA_17580 [Dictyobacter alpinus]|uniref:Uncharacterized protein n=2 Tax=Dictyobacter alpinus TaxID=2014873 RepID=A0A402B4J1_9CHLR|nr:hypothetical protein KDA_17580 [Dictyobacter alpinus]